MNIGEKIKTLRKKNRITQNDLAKAIGVSSKTVARWENLERKITGDYIKKIADFFDFPTSHLLDDQVEISKTDSEDGNLCAAEMKDSHDDKTLNNHIVIEEGEGKHKKRYILPPTTETYDFMKYLSDKDKKEAEPVGLRKEMILKMMEDMSEKDIARMFDFLNRKESEVLAG